MDNSEKIARLKIMLSPEEVSEEELEVYLDMASRMVLSRRYPFGYPEGMEVPTRYEQLQIELAIELYNRKGAEGQDAHTENGITRSWNNFSSLKQITPCCESVVDSNANS